MSLVMDQADPQIRLKPLDISGLPGIIEIPPDGVTLGRDLSNSVVLAGDRFPFVSGFHAKVSWEEGTLVVEDLDSRNGTFVNGKRIQRARLKIGDIVQLGKDVGVRFLVASEAYLDRTIDVPRATFSGSSIGMSLSRILRLKAALGVRSEAERQQEISRLVNRRLITLIVALVVVLAAVAGYLILQTEELEHLRDFTQQMEGRLADAASLLAVQQRAWEQEKARLEGERRSLLRKINELETSGRSSADEILSLREELAATSEKLDRYRPRDLADVELAKKRKLEGVLRAITLVEQTVVFREEGSTRYLHRDSTGQTSLRMISRDRSELYEVTAGTGSGFCVSPGGWILTNAHVVAPPAAENTVVYEGKNLLMEPALNVVFTETSERHVARVVKVAAEGTDDFALLRIEPYPDMPYVEDFQTDIEAPEAGADVTLFGFPLGLNLPQDEDALRASVFTGIVSRRVGPYLQVQAAVYPGNSGGPVVDAEARVIGMVTAVQMVERQIASDIGFVLPVSNLASLWPPDGSP